MKTPLYLEMQTRIIYDFPKLSHFICPITQAERLSILPLQVNEKKVWDLKTFIAAGGGISGKLPS